MLVITAETGEVTFIVGLTESVTTAKDLVQKQITEMQNVTITQDWSFFNQFGNPVKTEVLYCEYPGSKGKVYKRIYRITDWVIQ